MPHSEPAEKMATISLFDLLNYLIRYSSASKRLSVNEIIVGMTAVAEYCDENSIRYDEMVEWDYDQIENILHDQIKYDKYQYSETIKKQVLRLLEKYLDINTLFGVCIRASNPATDSTDQVYYAESLFDNTQINILRDSLAVYPYAEPDETDNIISRLNELTDVYNREDYNPELVSAVKYPGTYYDNLHEITKAFAKFKPMPKRSRLTKEQQAMRHSEYERIYSKGTNKIQFKYCAYDENKRLKVRVSRRTGEIRVVNPVKLMWVNGFYYLVTYSLDKDMEPVYINYRVDRMIEVKCLDEEAVLPKNFFADEYKYENPVMYSRQDKCDEIVIRCKKSVINNAIDTFGFNIEIEKTEFDDEVIIRLSDISPDGVKMWALEYGYGAEVISPESVREDIAKSVKRLAEMYIK